MYIFGKLHFLLYPFDPMVRRFALITHKHAVPHAEGFLPAHQGFYFLLNPLHLAKGCSFCLQSPWHIVLITK